MFAAKRNALFRRPAVASSGSMVTEDSTASRHFTQWPTEQEIRDDGSVFSDDSPFVASPPFRKVRRQRARKHGAAVYV